MSSHSIKVKHTETLSMVLRLTILLAGIAICESDNVKTLVTFNADLSPFICPQKILTVFNPVSCNYEKRLERQIELIKGVEKADVMCLQGVWYTKDLVHILRETKTQFGYSFSFRHKENGNIDYKRRKAPCSDLKLLSRIQNCDYHDCITTPFRWKVIECMEEKCKLKSALEKASALCLECLTQGTIYNFRECLYDRYDANPTGLLLLSREPILSRRYVKYHESKDLVPTGYLDVNIKSIGRVICTHLTEQYSEDYLEVSKEFSSYEDKNWNEVLTLMRVLKRDDRSILMGDFNISPYNIDIHIGHQFVAAQDLILENKFVDPLKHTAYINCLYCCSNELIRNDKRCTSEINGFTFEHIYLKGYKYIENQLFRTFIDYSSETALSRYYGLSVQIVV